ncbi:MAG: type II toxin-antitoxin system MqsR family toxin [Terriglobales bacterium]
MHPTCPLKLVKGLMKDGSWIATASSTETAVELGFEDDDIYDCIVNQLSVTHFQKTMPSDKKPSLMQDVYHITYCGVRLYVKLQVNVDAVVVSFKER